jgi:hypothetical protein
VAESAFRAGAGTCGQLLLSGSDKCRLAMGDVPHLLRAAIAVGGTACSMYSVLWCLKPTSMLSGLVMALPQQFKGDVQLC